MYKRILIATDGSKFGRKAVSHGVNLAAAMGTPVSIITATEMWSGIEMARQATSEVVNPISDYEKAAAESANKILDNAKTVAVKAGLKVECIHVRDQHPADAIIETARKGKCGLIVLGSHGRRGIEKVLMGSITSEVITRSNIPVLVVK